MRRMRPDIVLETIEEMANRIGATASAQELDEEDIWPWMEEQRLQGQLTGSLCLEPFTQAIE